MNRHVMFGLICMLGAMFWLGFHGTTGAQPMGPGMMGGYGYGYGYHSLSPEKQAKAQQIYADYYAKTITLRQQILSKQSELNALIYSGKDDEKKIQSLTKEISDLRSKIFESQVALQRQLAKEDLPSMGGMGGYGPMGPGMMGPGFGMY